METKNKEVSFRDVYLEYRKEGLSTYEASKTALSLLCIISPFIDGVREEELIQRGIKIGEGY